MATINEMLKIAGTIENAEKMARKFVKEQGPNFLMDLQLLLSIQGKFDEAFEINNRALKEIPDDLRVKHNRGWFLLRNGEFKKAFEMTNQGRLINTWGNAPIETSKPYWNGETGHRVLVNFEAGFGDQIIFTRFIKTIKEKGCKPIICCAAELMELFSCIDEADAIIQSGADRYIYFDSWFPSMGLPIILNTEEKDLESGSYLKADSEHIQKFKEVIKTKRLKVGIAWMGNPQFEHEQFRKFSPELMFDAVQQDGIKVHSLQIGADVDPPEDVIDLKYLIKTWSDTAGAIANLDLIITSCTSIAHLAAAMGKPTWVITPILPYWIWAKDGDKTPWYDSVKIYRQEKFNEWEHPFEKIRNQIKKMMMSKK